MRLHSKDARLLVLTALAEGPMHGYAVNTAIEALTGARLGAAACTARSRGWKPGSWSSRPVAGVTSRGAGARSGSPARAGKPCGRNWNR